MSINPETRIPDDVHAQLTDSERASIRTTAPILAVHGGTITRHFYKTMINENPSLRDIFSHSSQETGHQADALAAAVHAYAANIDDLTPILPVVERIAHKHAGLGVAPEHYGIVGKYLLQAIKDILGDAFTDDLFRAWYQAYWLLAKVFIDAEANLYKSAQWAGFRDFKVDKKVHESDDITSFYLTPVDKDLLPLRPYQPGQYLTVRVRIDELDCYQNRHYSLSDAPSPSHYRISVKREAGLPTVTPSGDALDTSKAAHPGWLSNVLHTTVQEGSIVQCAFPFGEFHLASGRSPVVLISAGVGVTPMLAMFNTLAEAKGEDGERSVTWIHGARGKSQHAFGSHVRNVVAKSNGRIRSLVFYSGASDADVGLQGEDFNIRGRVDLKQVDPVVLHLEDAQFYICGPDKFMNHIASEIAGSGVPSERIFMEAFEAGGVKA